MSDQIAHQDGDDVVIHRDHSYTDYYYSSPWLIATAGPCKLECGWKGGERSGLAQGQELTGRKKNKNILTGRKENILDTDRPSHGRT